MKENVDTSMKQFGYTPQNSRYSVSFSGTPTIKETMFPINGNSIKSETAELILANDYSFQRTESLLIDLALSESYNKESVYNMLSEYSEGNGLSHPEINYNETTSEKIGTLRGYKKVSIESKEDYNVTYFTKVYVRDTFLFIVTVGSISDKYPTDKINSFLNSVRFKN
jgi:hypothetical protein